MLDIAGKVVLCCSLTTPRLALRLWNCGPLRSRLLEFREEVDEVRERSGLNVGGSGEGNRCSRLISLYLSDSASLTGVDGGRKVKSMGEARNAEATADAVMEGSRPIRSQCSCLKERMPRGRECREEGCRCREIWKAYK